MVALRGSDPIKFCESPSPQGLLSACYPGTVDDLTQLDLVVTSYDTGLDFQSVRTFAMPDQVIDVPATESNWDFGLDPEIGVLIPNGSSQWVLMARYNYAFSAGDLDTQEWLTVQIGLQYN